MNTSKTDKSLSGIFILLTIIIVFFSINSENFSFQNNERSVKELIEYLFTFYFDFILIGYIFICLQFAGYVELKYRQDFLITSLIFVLFTPLSILFLEKKNENEKLK